MDYYDDDDDFSRRKHNRQRRNGENDPDNDSGNDLDNDLGDDSRDNPDNTPGNPPGNDGYGYEDSYGDEYEDYEYSDYEYGDYEDYEYDEEDYDDPRPYGPPYRDRGFNRFNGLNDPEAENDRWQVLRRFPRVPISRRAAALAIDAILAGVPSSAGQGGGEIIGFALLWFILRVVVVVKNHGQSVGHWALDMRVIDTEFGRLPGILSLCQREAVLGIATFLFLEAIVHLGSLNALVILGLLPLAFDGVGAVLDTVGRQTFHDRLGNTYVVHSRRGYSLDLRLKKLLAPSPRPPLR
jgi:uncharacterized RDD family membrane protein YckC